MFPLAVCKTVAYNKSGWLAKTVRFLHQAPLLNALVDKLVKLPDLDSGECVGSNPTWGTKKKLSKSKKELDFEN